MKVKHPLHLAAIALGMIGMAVIIWRQDIFGTWFPALISGMIAFMAAVDLARRLGLEPPDDPAAPHNQMRSR